MHLQPLYRTTTPFFPTLPVDMKLAVAKRCRLKDILALSSTCLQARLELASLLSGNQIAAKEWIVRTPTHTLQYAQLFRSVFQKALIRASELKLASPKFSNLGLNAILQEAQNLEGLVLIRPFNVDFSALNSWASAKKLTSITISSCPGFFDQHLSSLLQSPLLANLTIENCPITGSGFSRSSALALRKVRLIGLHDVTRNGVAALSRRTTVREVELFSLSNLPQEAGNLFASMPCLESLVCRSMYCLGNEFVTQISQSTTIKSLSLSGQAFARSGMEHLIKMSQPRSFRLIIQPNSIPTHLR